ncbi:AcrR family transcriptional regulator [Lipingzhangella halophila]|uniref:AcrR family transcriptional regulator n=1 Tax=Lipingzhangella halophila TaxID=1783352 RepID=A0A7W7RND5_9ACTN|nr:TetR/AcrR family transcriptional regulator C-terminal domain-containing protein [Lipingzhangella halophila]MBB4935147.1 AcrR family transcriptional regulator [Lipingzhangella halophila]
MAARHDTNKGERPLVWERPEPPNRPTPSPLSRDRIVRAAIELADADGLGEVSLRKVAAVLDAGPMRLYGYVATKEELLDLMVDAVYAEITPPEPTGADWRATLRSLAHRTRQAAQRHEWFVDLLGGRPHIGPNALAHLEATTSALDGAPNFDDIDTVMRAAGIVHSYTLGALRAEITERRAERASGMSEQQWQTTSGPYITRMLATGRYPTLARALHDATHPGTDATFEVGLDCVLDGIAARLGTRRR